MILETVMREHMYDVPSDESIAEILIDKETVVDKTPPLIKRRSEQIAL
jgi:ATP-dependent Clp protease ATP-binding subunit ClpX